MTCRHDTPTGSDNIHYQLIWNLPSATNIEPTYWIYGPVSTVSNAINGRNLTWFSRWHHLSFIQQFNKLNGHTSFWLSMTEAGALGIEYTSLVRPLTWISFFLLCFHLCLRLRGGRSVGLVVVLHVVGMCLFCCLFVCSLMHMFYIVHVHYILYIIIIIVIIIIIIIHTSLFSYLRQ